MKYDMFVLKDTRINSKIGAQFSDHSKPAVLEESTLSRDNFPCAVYERKTVCTQIEALWIIYKKCPLQLFGIYPQKTIKESGVVKITLYIATRWQQGERVAEFFVNIILCISTSRF